MIVIVQNTNKYTISIMQIIKVTFNAAAPSANQPSGYKEFKAIADSL